MKKREIELKLHKFALLLFLLSFTVIIASGCSILNSPPEPVFNADPQSGDAPLEVSFDASGSFDPDGGVVEYDWDFGDGSAGSGMTTTHTYDNAGDYTVELEVVDGGGASESTTGTISVSPSPPSASFTASPTSGEEPLTVSFDASESEDPDGRIESYRWDFDDGSSASGLRVSHTFVDSGRYEVELAVTDDDGNIDSTAETIYVSVFTNQGPIASFEVSPDVGEPPLDVSFNASDSFDPDGDVERYRWDFDDGSTGLGEFTSHTFSEAGTFNVELTVVDDYGKEDTEVASVYVSNELVRITDWELVEGNSGEAVVEGTVKNITSREIGSVTVVANFYCPRGNLIGMNEDTVDGLGPGEVAEFRISSSFRTYEIGRVELEVEV